MPGRQEQKWDWRKNYRVWDANRKVFLYPENWIEPDLRPSPASRAATRKIRTFICKRARRKSLCALLKGRNRKDALVITQMLAREMGRYLYRVDARTLVSKYIGETEKNLKRAFDAARKSRGILFFDEADALFGKRSEVKDSHDRYARTESNYVLQRIEKHDGLVIMAIKKRSNIDPAFLRRMRFIALPPRRKLRG